MNNLEIGISTASFFLKDDTENNLKSIQDIGFKTIEVFLSNYYEYQFEYSNLLKSRLGSLKVHSIHALPTQYEPEIFNPYQRTRQEAEKTFIDICRSAQNLDAKYYTFHGVARLKRLKYNIDYHKVAKRYQEIKDIASNYDIDLCLENVHWAHFNSPEFYKNLSKYISNLSVCLDIKQAYFSNISYIEYLKVMKGKIKTVHVCDYDENKFLSLPGRGTFDFVDFFKRLIDSEYNGPIMMEVYSSCFSKNSEILESKLYLEDCLLKAQK